MKTSFERLNAEVINYRDYKSFENKLFWEELLYELSNATLGENADGFEEFVEICQKNSKPTCQKKSLYEATICHLLRKPFQKQ